MRFRLLEEKGNFIAPFFITLFVFSVPISPSLKSIFLVLSLISILFTPFYRQHLFTAFNTIWGRAALVMFLYVALASLWSEAPVSMRLNMIEKYLKLLYLPLFAVAFIIPKTRKWAFNAYFAAILLTCLVSFLKQMHVIAPKDALHMGQVFYNHIATGFMVALAVYWAGVLYFENPESKWERIYYLLVILVGSYQVFFLNWGRTGYFIYGILMIAFLLQKLVLKKALIGVALFGVALSMVYMLSPLMQARTQLLVSDIKLLHQNEKNTSLGLRSQFHDYARSLFEKSPITGIGTGAFKYQYSKDQPIVAWGPKLNEPHSQYWLTLAEQGLIGIVLLIVFLTTLLVTAFNLKETKPILLGILIAFVFGSLTDSILCYSPMGTLLILFSALSLGGLVERKSACKLAAYNAPLQA